MGKSEILLTIVAFVFGIAMFALVSNVVSGSNNVIVVNKVFNDVKNLRDIVDLEKTMNINGSDVGTIANNLFSTQLGVSSVHTNKNYQKVFNMDLDSKTFKSKNSGISYKFTSSSVDKYKILINKQGISSDDINSILTSDSLKKICNAGIGNVDTNTIECIIE
ncbi:hypothetical protein [Aliarcobacter butzleri]|uniref:hypothetical protein n=1 Tax=Aliarcobacter butzleri TaxID=28197 RepID=UPI00263F1702|nr:hypothetical protein [Aliarcobacter butzleri]MDN5082008.1 hypothetical protein [Aliarcobacter butzleri]MDN5084318.1 hypothetical protein [Aliarcobacter butzleri]